MSVLQKIHTCIKLISRNQYFFRTVFYLSKSEKVTITRDSIQIKFQKVEKDDFRKTLFIYPPDSWRFAGDEKEKIRIVYYGKDFRIDVDCSTEEEKCEDFINRYIRLETMHSWLDEIILFLI